MKEIISILKTLFKFLCIEKKIKHTCGSLDDSERHAGGPGGEGHSREIYEPESSHSARYDPFFGG